MHWKWIIISLTGRRRQKMKQGKYDYEAIDALNRPLLNSQLTDLIAGKEVQIPHFDFKAGRSSPGEIIQLHPGQLIVLEGIHGLNPKLLPDIPAEQSFRIYVSSLTQLNLDKHNRISTTDTRLIQANCTRCIRTRL